MERLRDPERIQDDRDGLMRLRSAALDFAHEEAKKIAQLVIDHMRSQSPVGIFGDLAARHMWDEYCWAVQEGPFDVDFGIDGVGFGSVSDAWEAQLRGMVQSELQKLPKHAMAFLSALAFEEEVDGDAEEFIGYISIDGVSKIIIQLVDERASSRRNLELIGPNRGDAIGYHIEGSGIVWSVLDDASDTISGYVDEMIDPDANLSRLAEMMVDQFMIVLAEGDENTAFTALLERFRSDIRTLVLEKDVVPSLDDMRASLINVLDE
ncbi:hypothetical protein AMST5_01331 [freshwater sediment metagenome]|uniref:Uncharacterized protein n=1 Tax=freshwater sediment metagenome TaxID=556182 RepID=A0AA48RCL7_9ZZZZ